jgi:hypothetical protein
LPWACLHFDPASVLATNFVPIINGESSSSARAWALDHGRAVRDIAPEANGGEVPRHFRRLLAAGYSCLRYQLPQSRRYRLK